MVKESFGVVLKSIPYSESSIISRIFTPGFGKISVIARGAKKIKSGKSAMLEPMNIIELQMNYNESKDLHVLREISVQQNLSKIRANIRKMAIGLVMIEVLDKTTHPSNPAPILYRLIESSLFELNNSNRQNFLLFIFCLIQFSKYSGFNPLSENCHHCAKLLTVACFNLQNGFLDCENCCNADSLILETSVFLQMKQISNTHIKNLNDIEIIEGKMRIIEKYLLQFMAFHVQGMHNIKSLTFLNSVITK